MPITIGKPIEIDGKEYLIEKILGKGGLSIVYLGKESESGDIVAIKEFVYQNFYDPYTRLNDCEEYWENEVLNTQAQANSGYPSVKVLAYEKKVDLQTPEYYIVLSFIEGQTFLEFYRDFILTCRGLENLDLASMVRYIYIPLAEHLHYCHSKENIVHRDFAVNNIIIQRNEDGEFWPVLIDWGLSYYTGPDWIFYTPKPFMQESVPKDIPVSQKGAPPEIKNGYIPIAATDIYYLGHLMYFTFTGGIIREDSEISNPDKYILDPRSVNMFLPESYNIVVKKLTQYEPDDRPKDMKEVIKLLRELITINSVHFDFDFFMKEDTDQITGIALPEEKPKKKPIDNLEKEAEDEKLESRSNTSEKPAGKPLSPSASPDARPSPLALPISTEKKIERDENSD